MLIKAIKKGGWNRSGAIILPSITIGGYPVVAAGAVVTKDVTPHTMVACVPIRPIKRLKNVVR